MKAFILIPAFFCIIGAFSQLGQAIPTVVARLQMKMNETSMMNQTQKQVLNKSKLGRGVCSQLITIDTSCLSTPYNTGDQIDVKFGDANGKEVFAPRLDMVVGLTFERCSTTTFRLIGPCIDKICTLYLFRKGGGGWIPEKVTAYDYKYPPITFYYNFYIPDDDFGYGFNYCALP